MSPSRDLLALYVEFLQEPSAPMRRVAAWELGRLGDRQAAEHLRQAITGDADWECRHYAVMALANVGGPAEAEFLRELALGEYLSPNADGLAGPAPAALADHLLLDLEHSAQCCAGQAPRPSQAPGKDGEWWRPARR